MKTVGNNHAYIDGANLHKGWTKEHLFDDALVKTNTADYDRNPPASPGGNPRQAACQGLYHARKVS